MNLYKYEWSEYKLALQYKIKSRYFDVNVTEGVPNYQKKLRLHVLDKLEHMITYVVRYTGCINLLKPTGYVMHQQFNIQQLYALPTLYLCVLCLSENKQRLVPLTS